MKGMMQLSAIAFAVSLSGATLAETPTPAQQMETAKTNIKTVHEQELRNHLLQNQAEQKQLQAALQQKQHEQLQMMQDLEQVKAAK